MNIPGEPKVLRHFLFSIYFDLRNWYSIRSCFKRCCN